MLKQILFLSFFCFFVNNLCAQTPQKILVFSKTKGWRHTSIPQGQKFLFELGKKYNFGVDTTENGAFFKDENLKNYSAVVFLSTTGDVLTLAQQAAFERYIQSGGGYLGIHAASDTEYNWPWYNDLMGGYFDGHPGNPNVQEGKMTVLDKNHPSTATLPTTFSRKDEFYNFKSMKKENLHFLISVDENSYKEGKMGDFHPMAWYHEYDGGKAFYTNFGHTDESFSEPIIVAHIWGGLQYVMSKNIDYSKAKSAEAPDETRLVKSILVNNLDEPTELAIMPNGKVIFLERKGLVKMWNPMTKKTKIVGKMNAYIEFEYGAMGIGLDPNFENNNQLYIFYTPDKDGFDQYLSRFEYDQKRDTLMMETEKIVLKFPVKKIECCHTGGSIEFDNKGNLYLSTGDDTNPFLSDGYAPINGMPGHEGEDARRSAGNTNDLRGKILRIKVKDDATYTIPEGNLFPVGTENTRQEIYVMGCRNPYRIAIDSRNNYLYWGDVGPDAGKDNEKRGPRGYVEFDQARKAGNYGWPLFAGDNKAYRKYDFATKTSGDYFDPLQPLNDSPNNTGLKILPPAQKAMIWYSYGPSKEFPTLGEGGCNPMAGPVYYSKDYENNVTKLPTYYDGKLFGYEWMRDWIITISLDKDGNYADMERFMPNTEFPHPMDMAFHKDGTMYLLEYGYNWFAQNEEATLSKIEYNRGNRKPVVKMNADKKVGKNPLKVNFSSKGTLDYDGDLLTYEWDFGKNLPKSNAQNPSFTFQNAGIYEVVLTVKDALGNQEQKNMQIKVGNETPKVSLKVKGNQTFFFNNSKNNKDTATLVSYKVDVKDREDGKLGKGISPSDVVVSINFQEGYDKAGTVLGHQANVGTALGKRLMELSDCKSCHNPTSKSIGPTYTEIAKKYKKTNANIAMLTTKINNGGGGVWGEQSMSAHPQLKPQDIKKMLNYIFSFNDENKEISKPIEANDLKLTEHSNKKEGTYIIQAGYTDRGFGEIGTLVGGDVHFLRSPTIFANDADTLVNIKVVSRDDEDLGLVSVAAGKSYLRLDKIDLTSITGMELIPEKGKTKGKVAIVLDAPNNKPLATATMTIMDKNPLKIPLKKTQNLHDIYLEFDTDDWFLLQGIRFLKE